MSSYDLLSSLLPLKIIPENNCCYDLDKLFGNIVTPYNISDNRVMAVRVSLMGATSPVRYPYNSITTYVFQVTFGW